MDCSRGRSRRTGFGDAPGGLAASFRGGAISGILAVGICGDLPSRKHLIQSEELSCLQQGSGG